MQSFVVSMQTISHVLAGDEVVQCIESKVDERLEQNDGLIGQMNQLIKTLRYEYGENLFYHHTISLQDSVLIHLLIHLT